MKSFFLVFFTLTITFVYDTNAQAVDSLSPGARRSPIAANDSIRKKQIRDITKYAQKSRLESINNDSALMSLLVRYKDTTLTTLKTDSLVAKVAADTSVDQKKVTSRSVNDKRLRNNFKVNLLGLVVRNFSFQYERIITKRISAAIGFRFMPEGKIPIVSNLAKALAIDDKDILDGLLEARINNLAITPELRIYLGRKGYGKGFYIAPFYRYSSYEIKNIPIQFGGDKPVVISGKIKTNTFGLLFGSHWSLSKRISLDWWLSGYQFGTHNGEMTGLAEKDLIPDQVVKLSENIKKITLPNVEYSTKVTNNSVRISTSGPWMALRTGLCLGIRF
jgi:hypothetical protein